MTDLKKKDKKTTYQTNKECTDTHTHNCAVFHDAHTLLNKQVNELVITELIWTSWLSTMWMSAESESLHVAALVDRHKGREKN